MKLNAGTVFNTPPPTQGLASLLILALYERLRVAEAESFEFAHGLVECTKRAFRVRDRYVTDPAQLPHPPARYLDPKFLDIEVQKIDRRKAAKWPAPPGEGDTIWMGAADASGLVVSYIQSLYWEFGSGCVLPATGVLMQNRGASFSLDPKAVNPLQPGRLPFHTLNPALAVLGDGRVMAYGTMGGDGQPQTQAMLFARHVLYRQPLDKALDAPRWLLGRTWGSRAHQPADGVAVRRQPDRPADVGRPRRRGAGRGLFRHDGPRRRGGAASGPHAGRRARSARRWRARRASDDPPTGPLDQRSSFPVLLVGHLLHPGHVSAVERLLHGEMRHRHVGRGAVPVLLARREEHRVAGAHLLDRSAPGLHAALALRDVDGLAERMRVPGGARAGLEAHPGGAQARRHRAPR